MGVGFSIESIDSYEEVIEDIVYDLSIIGNENYFIDGDILVHNSSKTWDTFHLIYAFCDHNRHKWNDIYILRDTLTNCRDFTMKEFVSCLKVIGTFDTSKLKSFPKPYYELFGNHIYFRGLEDEDNSEGYPSDVLFINESLETRKTQVEGLKMRCRKLMIYDWNPKYTEHWCFDLEQQPNVFFTRTNYRNNKHLQKSVIKEIESYNPYEEGSITVKNHKMMYNGKEVSSKNQPPPNKLNIDSGTADLFRYKVYNLGLRGAMKGIIFNNVEYIDKFPDLAETFGLDFGFTSDPTALVRYAQEGNNIYLELLSYEPIETEEEITAYFESLKIEKLTPMTADSSDKYISEKKGVQEMVTAIRREGYSCTKVRKTQSVMYWLLKMKTFKIHIIKNNFYKFALKEAENYRLKEINGISINQPDDKFNHFWDASRYAFMNYNANNSIWG